MHVIFRINHTKTGRVCCYLSRPLLLLFNIVEILVDRSKWTSYILVWYQVRVVNRKPKVVFSVGFSRFFPTESRLFKVGFSVAQKNRNRKTDWVCWVVFFPHVPYANNAYISVLKPRLYGQSSSPRRQQHAAEQQSTGITFFYIPGTGSGIMASYPLRGFYRI